MEQPAYRDRLHRAGRLDFTESGSLHLRRMQRISRPLGRLEEDFSTPLDGGRPPILPMR